MLRTVGRIIGAVVSKLIGAVGNVQPLTRNYCVGEVPISAAQLLSLALRKRQEAFAHRKLNLRIQLLHTLLIKSLRRQLINDHPSARRKRSAYELSDGVGLLHLDDVVTVGRMFRTSCGSDDYEPPSKRARCTGQDRVAFYAYYRAVKRSLNPDFFLEGESHRSGTSLNGHYLLDVF